MVKGIILAGGSGTRLSPCTKVTNKHLLPVLDRPMIYYAINKLLSLRKQHIIINEIIIVIGIEHASHFPKVLGHGQNFGVKITYVLQDEPLGIAHALSLTEPFVKKDSVCVILGDNIFVDDIDIDGFVNGARVFLKEVPDPQRFGVATIKDGRVIKIVEKPDKPESAFVVTGLYLFDNSVFDIIRTLKPSARGEYELTDVNNVYIRKEQLEYRILKGFWQDAGTFDSLLKASNLVKGLV